MCAFFSEKARNGKNCNPDTKGWSSNISAVNRSEHRFPSLQEISPVLGDLRRDFRQFVTNLSQEFFNSGLRLQIPDWLPCKHPENYASKSPYVRGSLLDMINHGLRCRKQSSPSEITIGLPFLIQTKIPNLWHKFSAIATPST